jgi:DnaJ-domain-containing protein 1
MECNKDEATRAKEIAEKKLFAKDIAGAKKFALKAQNLYPGLEGIPQMLATLDVYIAAENKINGEADWYGILGADPQADDEMVRKHYRKLALMLHPDKNKSIGADGAFKCISEAWSLLSDKTKRVAYDQRRNGKVFQKGSSAAGSSSAKPGSNGSYNFTKSSVKTHKSSPRTGHSSTPASSYKTKPVQKVLGFVL